MPHVTLEQAKAAKASALRWFERIGQVVGVGVTRVGPDYAVKVNLSSPIASDIEIPTKLEGVPIRVEITGPIKPRRA